MMMVHLEMTERGEVEASMAGETIMVAVKIGYPGSRVSDILIGGHLVKGVPNDDLRTAYLEADEICDANFDGG